MSLVPVSRERHGEKKLTNLTSYGFAARTPLVQIVAAELSQVAACYPILFVETQGGQKSPHALLGLAKEENLFVSGEGSWTGYYIPATFRRYPFQLGRAEGQEEATVLIDEEAGLLSDTDGEPLFGSDEGEPSGPLARAIQLLTDIEMQLGQTAKLCEVLAKHDLFEPFPMQVGSDGKTENVEGLFKVSEAKLGELSDEAFLELRHSGALVLAHAQLLSLGQFSRLQARKTLRAQNVDPVVD